jgi:hypothetical protein
MEEYLKRLTVKSGIYTIPEEQFKKLLTNYTEMKNMIAKCVEIKKQYDILNANKDHVESQYLVIFQLQEKLKSVQQENAKLEQETRKAISVAQNAIDELKLARAKK